MLTRQYFVEKARKQLGEIHQYFVDAEHWNRVNMPCDRIDPDPDGTMHGLAQVLERFVEANTKVIDV